LLGFFLLIISDLKDFNFEDSYQVCNSFPVFSQKQNYSNFCTTKVVNDNFYLLILILDFQLQDKRRASPPPSLPPFLRLYLDMSYDKSDLINLPVRGKDRMIFPATNRKNRRRKRRGRKYLKRGPGIVG
jgi:hypothetical protein